MAAQKRRKKKGTARSPKKIKPRSPWVFALLGGVCLVIVAVGMLNSKQSASESQTPPTDNPSAGSDKVSANKQRDLLSLVGRWVRTDGGYVIEIRNIAPDGKMDAGYYNPRPINVSMAEASWAAAGTKIFIELQDVGYPGSTYTLAYNPAEDTLVGFYYQAAMQQNFDVVFARMQ